MPRTEATKPADTGPAIRDGMFFTLPDALPVGRHKLAREQVQEAQRERLLAAMTELLAERGLRGFGITDVAKRAGVSLSSFYACFAGKDACVFAGYERFIEVLLHRMVAHDVPDDDPAAVARALIGAYLESLQLDLVVARAYQVEIDALGAEARARRRESLELFAAYIKQRVADLGGVPTELPDSAYIGVVYAVRQLAADALDTAEQPDLLALAADLEPWVSDLFSRR